jgi:hypothetical protein
MCANRFNVSPMKVEGGHVEFGNFRGWVQPNGQLQTVYGEIYLYGQFTGTQFAGLVQYPPPGCSFRVMMNRTS